MVQGGVLCGVVFEVEVIVVFVDNYIWVLYDGWVVVVVDLGDV